MHKSECDREHGTLEKLGYGEGAGSGRLYLGLLKNPGSVCVRVGGELHGQ